MFKYRNRLGINWKNTQTKLSQNTAEKLFLLTPENRLNKISKKTAILKKKGFK